MYFLEVNSYSNSIGLFDSIIDFDSNNEEKNPNCPLTMTPEQRNKRLNELLMMMKTERNKLIDLLKTCDNERLLFRKLNLEMLKIVVDYKNGDVCVT